MSWTDECERRLVSVGGVRMRLYRWTYWDKVSEIPVQHRVSNVHPNAVAFDRWRRRLSRRAKEILAKFHDHDGPGTPV